MKIKKGFTLRELAGEQILVGEGLEQISFDRIIRLNSSAAFLWKSLENEESFDINKVVNLLINKYNIDSSTAERDARSLLDSWAEAGLIEK